MLSILRDSFFAHRCIIPKTFKIILMMWFKDYYVKTLPGYIRECVSFYLEKFLPILKLEGSIIEIDEVFLGAKKKDPRGRKPAISQNVFGIKQFILNNYDHRLVLS